MSNPKAFLPTIILASGLLFTAIGVGLLLAVDWLIGAIFIAVGLTDLVTVPILRGRLGAGARQAERTAVESADVGATPEADPSYNPYARED